MKITTCCTGLALLLLARFVNGQAAAAGGAQVNAPPPATMVWITQTNAAGVVATVQSAYVQTFSSWNGQVLAVPAGQIGLGSIQGQIGVTKTPGTQSTGKAKRTAEAQVEEKGRR